MSAETRPGLRECIDAEGRMVGVITAYVSIGNSDDKLTQREWATFVRDTFDAVFELSDSIHGSWTSASDSEWQNACWCLVVNESKEAELKKRLGVLARRFRQDSIAWAEVSSTEFLAGVA